MQILFLLFLTFALVIHIYATKQVQNVMTVLKQRMQSSDHAGNDASNLIDSYFEQGPG